MSTGRGPGTSGNDNDGAHGDDLLGGRGHGIDLCDAIEARVLEGVRAHEDPALAVHLGSCLRCFRTASELRELPRIEGFLRAAPAEVDPGEAFWQSFPGRVADAWAAAASPAAVVTPTPAVLPLWHRLTGWLWRPLPAALSGAACASVVFFLVARAHAPASSPTVVAEVPAAASSGLEDEGAAEHADHDDEIGEGFVHSLDATGLELLVEPERPGSKAAPEALEAEEDDSPAAEEIDLLDEAELRVLSGKLGRRI
jgi:hypothetical protein